MNIYDDETINFVEILAIYFTFFNHSCAPNTTHRKFVCGIAVSFSKERLRSKDNIGFVQKGDSVFHTKKMFVL